MMKKFFMVMLMVCLLTIPARAENAAAQVEEGISSRQEVVVTTLDEFKEAIAAANDGDIITITQKIKVVNEDISTNKNITITCTENFAGSAMFDIIGSSVNGLSFKGGGAYQIFAVTEFYEQEAIIKNCTFDGNGVSTAIGVYGSEKVNTVRIADCEFKDCFRSAISARSSTDVIMDRCFVHDTYAIDASGSVDSSGNITLNDCIITGNSAYANAGVRCSGTLVVSGGQIQANTIRSTENGVAVDVFCSGIWSITDVPTEDAGYYDTVTGEKLSLPICESDVLTRLVYLKDEDAREYFSFLFEPDTSEDDANNIPELPQEPTQTPEGEGDGDGSHTNQPEASPQEPEQIPEPPKEPVDSEGDSDMDDSSGKQPETPNQPSHSEDGDDSSYDAPQPPEKPVDPPQADDVITDTTPDTPQHSQEPIDSTHGYIPYWPSARPTQPIIITTTPTDEPQRAPETPAPDRKPLVCNGVAIDTSKTIVLLGYGDGQLHEADSLTRAQLATIIFRLLDDDTVIRYSGAGAMFTDVAADAWYAPYVNAIGIAGIVNGVSNGMYDPNGTVTWAQIITILTRFVESESYELRHIQYSGWALEAIQTAVVLEWIEDSSIFNPNAIISRGELVNLINTVFERCE